ncbi:MAG: urea ABC transporter permease subunit UrtB, partial [Alphaproteobacteria bacterium]|nr:urea ABC transporter permease subunit UrtB [Alphaproteobacteria bacterium]
MLFAAMLLTFVGVPRPATAQSLDEAARQLAANEFASTSQAIRLISASGAPHAAAVLDAMAQNRLFIDPASKTAFYEETPGVLKAVRDGAALTASPDRRERLRVNNRIRREIADVLGALRLMAPEPAARIRASETIFRSRQEDALPALEAVLKTEKDARVRQRFEQARAAIVLTRANSSDQDRVDAISILQARGDQLALATLRNVPASAPAAIRDSSLAAAKRIEERIALLAHVQNVWYGLSLGSVLLLAAIGLAITFGVMGVINMAHGEMVMLGAYATFVVQELCRTFAPGLLDWSILIALPVAFVFTALVGMLIERGVISFLYGRPLETLLATWGVSLILQQAVRTTFGPTNREVSSPSYMSGAFDIMGVSITYGRLWIIVFTLALFFALLAAM